MEQPKIRALEAIPTQDNLICLRDPTSLSDKLLVISQPVLFLCSLMDGNRTIKEITETFRQYTGEALPENKIKEIIDYLDQSHFLENESFHKHRESIYRQFRDTPVRSAAHAGTAYESDPDSLEQQLSSYFEESRRSPGGVEAVSPAGLKDKCPQQGCVRAIIAPHIDLRRGGKAFAKSYARLAGNRGIETVVILGISHMPSRRRFILTEKSFETPFGTVETDKDFIKELVEQMDFDFFIDEFNHKSEHSIEFQLLFLQYLFQIESGKQAGGFRIVPILCSGFNDLFKDGVAPLSDKEIQQFITSLKMVIEKRGDGVCIIAGVDLSHVGKRFGQEVTITQEFLTWVEEEDRNMLSSVLDIDSNGFFSFIRHENDKRNVCGVPAIYTLLELLKSRQVKSELLCYDKAVEDTTQSVVSFASLAFYE